MQNPQTFYTTQLKAHQNTLHHLQRKKKMFGIIRFGNIAAVLLLLYFLSFLGWWVVGTSAAILLIIFARLVILDLKNRDRIAHVLRLIEVQQKELKALAGNISQFSAGTGFHVPDHAYAHDLDIFGNGSVYQFLNRTVSEPGSNDLAQRLLQPLPQPKILPTQSAVAELTHQPLWLQEFFALGMAQNVKFATAQRIAQWSAEPNIFLQHKSLKMMRYLLPAAVLVVSILAMYDVVAMPVFYGALLLSAAINYQLNKLVAPIHHMLGKMVDELETLTQLLRHTENANFKTSLLTDLQNHLRSENTSASAAIQKLKSLLNMLDIRYNLVLATPLNLFLFWNLQQVLALEKWKLQFAAQTAGWFSTVATLESLASFATMQFNYPEWAIPKIHPEHFAIAGTQIGHPLIPAAKRINNPIHLTGSQTLMLITGSNMAGKSTYLRSIGVNTVLAMAGAAVCAEKFTISYTHLVSSMRISDNLQESTSTFYAELKKLEYIIKRVNACENVFVLLDEILRGTNSYDRHTGSAALIKQMVAKHAAVILATHDVELAALQQTHPAEIANYHFDVQVQNEELFFDYKLKPGVCTSMNASILMKKIGIDL